MNWEFLKEPYIEKSNNSTYKIIKLQFQIPKSNYLYLDTIGIWIL
ncbi:hypothetical protein SAMN06265349_102915 [Flavobacterium resistens]|uniref:Uncharacterized protein n=1 Tax=Flavobacterium resistens TaxID=443612 RepID=A0A521CVV2_9FLAO|nr:hypothetical protein SAMN06265349_102915 [Flavobacterium resistens]